MRMLLVGGVAIVRVDSLLSLVNGRDPPFVFELFIGVLVVFTIIFVLILVSVVGGPVILILPLGGRTCS